MGLGNCRCLSAAHWCAGMAGQSTMTSPSNMRSPAGASTMHSGLPTPDTCAVPIIEAMPVSGSLEPADVTTFQKVTAR
jgi:hypothetical protein